MDDRMKRLREYGRVQVWRKGDTLIVTCPYHEDFAAGARELGGRWDRTKRRWVLPEATRAHLLKLIDHVFGADQTSKAQRWCAHRYVKVVGGIRCILCGLFKQRAT